MTKRTKIREKTAKEITEAGESWCREKEEKGRELFHSWLPYALFNTTVCTLSWMS